MSVVGAAMSRCGWSQVNEESMEVSPRGGGGPDGVELGCTARGSQGIERVGTFPGVRLLHAMG